ncbi:MAG: hypothetical protein MJZ48_03205 [Paludibacteraceae bacterium]|nr:hypothetical protein [Paludibacteraceae bacterium]
MLKLLAAILVSASLDSTTIFLGDQTDLHLQVQAAADDKVQFPVYGADLIPEIEIVDRTIIDTTTLSDGRVQYDQYLTLTCFHDSLYSLPEIPFAAGNDTFFTNVLALNVVQPFEIDTTQAITDIKPVQKAPIWWWGICRWILLGLLLIGIGVGVYYLVRYLKRRKGLIPEVEQIPARPADEVALERLDAIKEQKLWQAGKLKEYHTALTDVVREYIASRFDVRSTEKTSDETLREMKPVLAEQIDLYQRLKQMLQLADLVKFAKWQATPDENERALTTAYDFVNQTTIKPQENDIS